MYRRAAHAALAVALSLTMTAGLAPIAHAIDGAAAASDDPVRASVPGTIERLGLQTALPHAVLVDNSGFNWNPHLPRGLIWILATIFAAILVVILRELIPGWRRRADDWNVDGIEAGAGLSSPRAGLAEADMLATDGRFVEAMHLLLLHSLAEIRRRLKIDFADSLTSREIVRRAGLPEEGRTALRGIVTRVELSYFGGYPAARPDYDVCRVRYQELSDVLARSPA
jgi:hypothetical protein